MLGVESSGCVPSQVSDPFNDIDLRIAVEQEVSRLPEEEFFVLMLYSLPDMNQHEVGKTLGISRQRASKKLGKIVTRLRRKLLG